MLTLNISTYSENTPITNIINKLPQKTLTHHKTPLIITKITKQKTTQPINYNNINKLIINNTSIPIQLK